MARQTGLILLAAGASRRMGRCKQLLPINGEAAIIHGLRHILAAGIEDIVVVVGHHREAVCAALSGLPVRIAANPEPESQMADSVRLGLAMLPAANSGILVALCDHPLVLPSTYRVLRQLHAQYPRQILQPRCQGRGGHPTLFPRQLLRQVESGKPMNRILVDHVELVQRLNIDDPGIIHDMDDEADYQRLLALAGSGNPVPSFIVSP